MTPTLLSMLEARLLEILESQGCQVDRNNVDETEEIINDVTQVAWPFTSMKPESLANDLHKYFRLYARRMETVLSFWGSEKIDDHTLESIFALARVIVYEKNRLELQARKERERRTREIREKFYSRSVFTKVLPDELLI